MRKFLALILVLSICSGSWANNTENLMRTEAQRKADFDQAMNENEIFSESVRKNFDDAIKKSRDNFLRLYRARWQKLGMNDKLAKAINAAFDKKLDGIWFSGIWLVANIDNILNGIQEATAFNFAESYDFFLRDVENKWGNLLQNDVLSAFNERGSIMLRATDKNPMTSAYIRESTASKDNGERILSEINETFIAKYPDLKTTGTIFAGGIALLFRKQLVNYLAKYAGKATIFNKVAQSATGKIIGKMLPLIGPVMLAWSVYDIASIVWSAKDDVRKILTERNVKMYHDEMPVLYWDVMEPYVMDVLISAYGVLQEIKKDAEIFAKDSRVINLSKSLSNAEAEQFATRIAMAVNMLGKDKLVYVLENFGEIIRDLSPNNFTKLMQILQQENIEQVNEWLKLAGSQYYDFYALFPRDIWEKFQPDSQSHEILSWMAAKHSAKSLDSSAIKTVSKLSVNDILFVMNDIPELYIPQLFDRKGKYNPVAVHYEIERLRDLPKASRVPWMSDFEYTFARYKIHITIGAVILFALAVMKRIRRRPQPQPQPSQPAQPIIITMPPQQPVQPVVVKKYKVKLIISHDFIDEARQVHWDISPTLIPTDDDSGKYVFEAELENLGDISRWIMKHRDYIEVLQPEELKHLSLTGETKA